MDNSKQNLELAAGIVSAYVGNNTVAAGDLPALIHATFEALNKVGSPDATAPADTNAKATAAQIRKSITPDTLISFEDGKPYRTLKRHLTTMGLTVEAYKAKWGLPQDYPTVAPSYSEARSQMAKALGLGLGTGGRGGHRGKAEAKPAKGRKA
jgi:predicted transcriptional regulator